MERGTKVQVFGPLGEFIASGVFLSVWQFYVSKNGEPAGLVERDDGSHAIAPLSWIKPLSNPAPVRAT